MSSQIEIQFGCVDSDEEIPSNISNLEVKLICGEGSARGTWCQNSKMHPLNYKKSPRKRAFLIPFNPNPNPKTRKFLNQNTIRE